MSSNRNVLVIDSDQAVSASITTLLTASGGYAVTPVVNAADAEHALASAKTEFDAVVMDIDEEGADGIETCARIRHHYKDIAIILMSSAADEMLLVRGLRAGADDFIRKPFRASELMARLQARLRSISSKSNAAVTIGRFAFHPDKRLLVDANGSTRIRLPEKEAKLLWHLHLGNGDVVSRVALLHAVWSYSHTASSHTVETHVYRLRQKIEDDPGRPAVVITERGGYRLAIPKPERMPALSFPLHPYVSSFSA